MRVLFIPDYSDGNPYQRALAAALRTAGWDVSIGRIRQAIGGGFDILHIHWPEVLFLSRGRLTTTVKALLALSFLVLLRWSGTQIVWTVHNIVSHEITFETAERRFMRRLARMCGGIISHTRHVKDLVIERYRVPPDAVDVIPHGNYIGLYDNRRDRRGARQKLGYSESDIVLATIGILRSYKGIPDLVEAFRCIGNPRLRLVLAGRPPDETTGHRIREICSVDERVRVFLGHIPDDEIQTFMNAADAIVLPYRDITTSGALMLAMSFGKAVIAPALPFMKETLPASGAILYEPRADGLRDALEHSINAINDLPCMGAANQAAAAAILWEDIGHRTAAIYRRALAKKSTC